MLIAAGLIIAAAIYLMVRRVDVRLVLLGAGLAMALLAGQPLAIADTFTRAMVTAMVAPICASMGFAALMHATGCDRHLVHALLAPLRRVQWLVVPGGILSAYLVNVAVPSQASTAAALGPILVPLLLASGRPPAIAGAALVLGASFGGDLLNPGAQDVQAVAGTAGLSAAALSARVIPASLAGVLVATVVFTLLNRRRKEPRKEPPPGRAGAEDEPALRVNPLKAVIPAGADRAAAVRPTPAGPRSPGWSLRPGEEWRPLAGRASGCAGDADRRAPRRVVAWREVLTLTKAFFDGMGAAYASIISLTITAQCFGAGVAAIGLADALLRLASASQRAGAAGGRVSLGAVHALRLGLGADPRLRADLPHPGEPGRSSGHARRDGLPRRRVRPDHVTGLRGGGLRLRAGRRVAPRGRAPAPARAPLRRCGRHGRGAQVTAGRSGGITGSTMCEGRSRSIWTVFLATRVRIHAPSGSPVLGLTSKCGKLLLEMSSRMRWPALNRLQVG